MHDEIRSFNDILNDFVVILEQHSEVLESIAKGNHTGVFIRDEIDKANKRIEIIKDSMNKFNSNGIYFGVSKTAALKYVSTLNSNAHVTEYAWTATKEMIDNGFRTDKAIFVPLGPTSIVNNGTVIFTLKTGEIFPIDAYVVW